MSLRKSFAGFAAAVAPFVLFSVNATQSRAQSEGDNATAVAPLYKTISVKPSKSGIDADRTTKTGPDELTATNQTPQTFIRAGYKVEDDQIVGAPSWLNSQRYDIDAKVANSATGQGELARERMLQALLSSRFKLAAHRETRLIPVYELVIAGGGPKLRESAPAYPDSAPRVIQVESGRITGQEVPIDTLARILSEELGRPVLDETRLPQHYDVTLQWPTTRESSEPTILTAIQDQLGLKLVPQLMPKEFFVIDHVEMPSAD
jgi:uncharacterized protein (TIGR03435 family)